MNLAKLHEPFPAADVEWRLQTAGKSASGFWARALAYITNRAIMERLDEVVGPENWRNEFAAGPHGGVLCGISVKLHDGWVTKWDGAENTDIEAVKGGLSNAMKRAAVQWGIGRYLYNLEEGWATCYTDERKGQFHGATKDKDRFSWDPPVLPPWALPGGSGKPGAAPAPRPAPAIQNTPGTATVTTKPSEPVGFKGSNAPDLFDQLVGFGKKYPDKTWGHVLEHDPSFIEWVIENAKQVRPEVKQVLKAALELHKEPVGEFTPRTDVPLTESDDRLPF